MSLRVIAEHKDKDRKAFNEKLAQEVNSLLGFMGMPRPFDDFTLRKTDMTHDRFVVYAPPLRPGDEHRRPSFVCMSVEMARLVLTQAEVTDVGRRCPTVLAPPLVNRAAPEDTPITVGLYCSNAFLGELLDYVRNPRKVTRLVLDEVQTYNPDTTILVPYEKLPEPLSP